MVISIFTTDEGKGIKKREGKVETIERNGGGGVNGKKNKQIEMERNGMHQEFPSMVQFYENDE